MKAVIDIGSNSVLMVIGGLSASGELEVVHEANEIAGLSRGMGEGQRLAQPSIDRALNLLRRYAEIARGWGVTQIIAVATEATRRAVNAEAFLRPAAALLGTDVEIISGAQEAHLSYVSVARECPNGGLVRVADIGGASTELACGFGTQVRDWASHPMGTVRLRESHLSRDPVPRGDLETVDEHIAGLLARQPLEPAPRLYGVAGTAISCAWMLAGSDLADVSRALREADGKIHSLHEIELLRDRLAAMDLDRRRTVPGLRPGLTALVVAGCSIVVGLMRHCGASEFVVRNRGLRYALLAGIGPNVDQNCDKS